MVSLSHYRSATVLGAATIRATTDYEVSVGGVRGDYSFNIGFSNFTVIAYGSSLDD